MMRRRTFAGPGLVLPIVLAVLLGVSGAVPPSTPGPISLTVDNAARSSTPNVQVCGLYGGVGTGNAILVNNHDQGYNANAQVPITAPAGEKAEVITGAFQTVLPNGDVKDINIPRPVSAQYVAGSTTQTASLMSWDGALAQVAMVDSRAGKSPIVVDGNLTLNADGSITVTNASGTAKFDPNNGSWSSAANPLKDVLQFNNGKFQLELGQADTIIVNGYDVGGSSAAESRGLDIRASLTYEGVGAFVVNVASGMEQRGIQVEGQAKDAQGVGTGSPVNVLASQQGDGLAFITNGRIYVNQEGTGSGAFVPTVQGFLYSQGYRDSNGQAHGVDLLGGNLQGMAIGSHVYVQRPDPDGSGGTATDCIMINGNQTTLTIPPQVPGGRPVYTASISNWRETR